MPGHGHNSNAVHCTALSIWDSKASCDSLLSAWSAFAVATAVQDCTSVRLQRRIQSESLYAARSNEMILKSRSPAAVSRKIVKVKQLQFQFEHMACSGTHTNQQAANQTRPEIFCTA